MWFTFSQILSHPRFNYFPFPQHTLVAAPSAGLIDSSVMVGDVKGAPLLYLGTGLITDTENPLVLPVLRAPSTAYCHNPTQPITDYPHATGKFFFVLNNVCVIIASTSGTSIAGLLYRHIIMINLIAFCT